MNTASSILERNTKAKEHLKLGAWYSIFYGYERKDVCVIDIADGLVKVEHTDWLLSGAEWENYSAFFSAHRDPIFLGYGKPRLIGGWLRRTFDFFCTLYTKPNRQRP